MIRSPKGGAIGWSTGVRHHLITVRFASDSATDKGILVLTPRRRPDTGRAGIACVRFFPAPVRWACEAGIRSSTGLVTLYARAWASCCVYMIPNKMTAQAKAT